MLLIFILKSVMDRMLPCGIPSSYLYRLENVDPIQTELSVWEKALYEVR